MNSSVIKQTFRRESLKTNKKIKCNREFVEYRSTGEYDLYMEKVLDNPISPRNREEIPIRL